MSKHSQRGQVFSDVEDVEPGLEHAQRARNRPRGKGQGAHAPREHGKERGAAHQHLRQAGVFVDELAQAAHHAVRQLDDLAGGGFKQVADLGAEVVEGAAQRVPAVLQGAEGFAHALVQGRLLVHVGEGFGEAVHPVLQEDRRGASAFGVEELLQDAFLVLGPKLLEFLQFLHHVIEAGELAGGVEEIQLDVLRGQQVPNVRALGALRVIQLVDVGHRLEHVGEAGAEG